MKGYPSIQQNKIILNTLLNPNLIFCQNIQVHSDVVDAANGEWTIYRLKHGMHNDVHKGDSDGSWFSEIKAHKPDNKIW